MGKSRRLLNALWGAFFSCLLLACSTLNMDRPRGSVGAVIKVRSGETLETLSIEIYGTPDQSWRLAQYNRVEAVTAGDRLVIPPSDAIIPPLPSTRYQTVPIFAYHRFTAGRYRGDRLELAAEDFDAHLNFLRENNFHIISMDTYTDYLDGKTSIPRKSVVITIDDGFKSVYDVAFPILKKHNAHATLYVYSDLVGVPAAVNWEQLKILHASGLVGIQSHSKSHANLAQRNPGESSKLYRKRIRSEFETPAELIAEKLGIKVHSFAYPYGAVTDEVAEIAKASGYKTAVTILRGSNPPYADPFTLQRTMIYGDHTIKDFARFLKTEVPRDEN